MSTCIYRIVGLMADASSARTRSSVAAPAFKPRGPHPDKRLSPVRVRALNKPGKYADGNGLYLVVDTAVDTTGAERSVKRWMLRTVVAGRRREIGLGSLRLVTLAEAREEVTRPEPLLETRGEFLERADRAWDEALSEQRNSGTALVEPRKLDRHCRWLVQYHVCRQPLDQILANLEVDPSVLRKALRATAQLLNIRAHDRQ